MICMPTINHSNVHFDFLAIVVDGVFDRYVYPILVDAVLRVWTRIAACIRSGEWPCVQGSASSFSL